MIPIYQYCPNDGLNSIVQGIVRYWLKNWLLGVIRKIGFDRGTMEWFESIHIRLLFLFVNTLLNK